MQVLSVHRRALLGHLGIQHHANRLGVRTHREGDAQVADDRTNDVAAPAALSIPPRLAAPQPNRGGVDRFLSERAKSLALKGHAFELHVASDEQLLETIVHGTRQHHAAQDLAPLFRRERRGDGCPCEKAVHVFEQLLTGCLQTRLRGDAGRRLWDIRRSKPRHRLPERATELLRELFDGRRISIRGRWHDVFEYSLDDRERERVPLEDERAEAGFARWDVDQMQDAKCNSGCLALHLNFALRSIVVMSTHFKGWAKPGPVPPGASSAAGRA